MPPSCRDRRRRADNPVAHGCGAGHAPAMKNICCVLLLFLAVLALPAPGATNIATKIDIAPVEKTLVARIGEAQRERIHRGLTQAAGFWRAEDGDAKTFADFATANVAANDVERDALFDRMQFALESLDGHVLEIGRDFRRQTDLDIGPIRPFDEVLAGWDPAAHVIDDFFANKLAFTVLLNFPITTLADRLAHGKDWTRRQWAETRLAERFSKRIPADVALANAKAQSDAAQYVASYNIWMHHLVDDKGTRLFPAKLRLLSHWNLRDEIKADYGDGANGLAKQRAIVKVMERIVTQTIPAQVVDNPQVDWNPWSNAVAPTSDKDSDQPPPATAQGNGREPDTRYARLLDVFRAQREADAWSPTAPTLIARRFEENRQLPEARVKAMLEAVLGSPLVPKVAARISSRLGRPLEPFDIWYPGFTGRGAYTEAQLDEIVRRRYPTAQAYEKDIPNLLIHLGFDEKTARMLANNIVVDPARGSGHAMGAARRADKAHLRTRVEKDGMNYKGFNIAVHEMGHNVEQTFSLNTIDYTLLQGVPNNAFTEALAFVFQGRDLELLGLAKPDEKSKAEKTLNDFWTCYEISGVALVDMGVWHWMYAHPDATPTQLRDATVAISMDVWNKWYAPIFGQKDVVLLGVYSHMIDSTLYLPDYPMGHMIAFQIGQQMEKEGRVGPAFERMAKGGNIAPDLWMINATGAPVGPDALLAAAAKALDATK
jgi:hypothetical protein